jgi:hypothetical protein
MAIGKLAVECSNIEFLLGVLLSRLLITPEFLGRTYTDNLSVAKIQDAITNALDIHQYRYRCKIISEENLSEISQINKRITEVRTLRNKLAHFCWMRSNDEKMFGTRFSGKVSKNKKPDKDCITLDVKELEKAYKEAYEIVDALSKIVQKLPQLEEDELLRGAVLRIPNYAPAQPSTSFRNDSDRRPDR